MNIYSVLKRLRKRNHLKDRQTTIVANEVGDKVTLSESEVKIYNRLEKKDKANKKQVSYKRRSPYSNNIERVYEKLLVKSRNNNLYEKYQKKTD